MTYCHVNKHTVPTKHLVLIEYLEFSAAMILGYQAEALKFELPETIDSITRRHATRDRTMTSAIYASLSAFLIVWLSLNVIKVRRTKQVSVGDGDDEVLKTAMAAQSNAIEYIPIALLLLFTLEYNHASLQIVHALGLFLLVGRLIHARAILTENLKTRVLGMQITIYAILGMAIFNIVYLPYNKILAF
jgi:uncharacterized membrane protein YecN with MAPEG domain